MNAVMVIFNLVLQGALSLVQHIIFSSKLLLQSYRHHQLNLIVVSLLRYHFLNSGTGFPSSLHIHQEFEKKKKKKTLFLSFFFQDSLAHSFSCIAISMSV